MRKGIRLQDSEIVMNYLPSAGRGMDLALEQLWADLIYHLLW